MSNLSDLKIEKGVPIPPDPEEEAGRLLDRLAEVGDSVVIPFGSVDYVALFRLAEKRQVGLRQERPEPSPNLIGLRVWRLR